MADKMQLIQIDPHDLHEGDEFIEFMEGVPPGVNDEGSIKIFVSIRPDTMNNKPGWEMVEYTYIGAWGKSCRTTAIRVRDERLWFKVIRDDS